VPGPGVGDSEGWAVTDFVNPYSLIPLAGDGDGQALTGHPALLQQDGADLDAPSRAYGTAGSSELSALAMSDGRGGQWGGLSAMGA
jgi:hypothetical protein